MILHTQIKRNNVLGKGNRACKGPTVRPAELVGGVKSSVASQVGRARDKEERIEEQVGQTRRAVKCAGRHSRL